MGANDNKVKLNVELGLDQAQQQATALQALLNKSVQPKTTAFKGINDELERIIKQTNRMKSSMDTAFKSSSTAAKYEKDLEKIFDTLSAVVSEFSSIKGKDLLAFDSEKVKDLQTQLVSVNNEIKELEKQKLGDLFKGDTKGFEEVRNFVAGFSKDISKVSFTEFNTALTKAMTQATNDVDAARKALEAFQNQTNVVKMDNIAKVIEDFLGII